SHGAASLAAGGTSATSAASTPGRARDSAGSDWWLSTIAVTTVTWPSMPTNTAAASTPNSAAYGPRARPATSTSFPAVSATSSGTAAAIPSAAPIAISCAANATLTNVSCAGATSNAVHTPVAAASPSATSRGTPPTSTSSTPT